MVFRHWQTLFDRPCIKEVYIGRRRLFHKMCRDESIGDHHRPIGVIISLEEPYMPIQHPRHDHYKQRSVIHR